MGPFIGVATASRRRRRRRERRRGSPDGAAVPGHGGGRRWRRRDRAALKWVYRSHPETLSDQTRRRRRWRRDGPPVVVARRIVGTRSEFLVEIHHIVAVLLAVPVVRIGRSSRRGGHRRRRWVAGHATSEGRFGPIHRVLWREITSSAWRRRRIFLFLWPTRSAFRKLNMDALP